MSASISPRHKLHRIDLNSDIKNKSLVQILNRYKTHKLKTKQLSQQVQLNNKQSYTAFLKKQTEYKTYQDQINTRIQSQNNTKSKKNKQNARAIQKKRKQVYTNHKQLEEISENQRNQNYLRQKSKGEKYLEAYETKLSQSYFARSNISLQSSIKIKNTKQRKQNQFVKNVMVNSMMKEERVKNYLRYKQSVKSEHIGAKDKSVSIVIKKANEIKNDKMNNYIQRYLQAGKNQESNYKLQQQKIRSSLHKQKKEYLKRKQKAWEKKRDFLQNKSLNVDHEFQESLNKFKKVQRHRKSLEINNSRHIQEHRNKISQILLRNLELKNKERQKKEQLVEIHQQKIKDIQKFKKEFDRMRMEVNNTFVTS